MIHWEAEFSGVFLPVSFLRSQRRLGASAWSTVRVPFRNVEDFDLLLMTPGFNIYADGDVFFSAFVTETRPFFDSGYGEVSLRARIQPVPFSPNVWVPENVVERRSDSGRRSLICDPNPWVRPNDTISDQGGEWLVGLADYSISPTVQQMRLVEVR